MKTSRELVRIARELVVAIPMQHWASILHGDDYGERYRALVAEALEAAQETIADGGHLLAKILEDSDEVPLAHEVRRLLAAGR